MLNAVTKCRSQEKYVTLSLNDVTLCPRPTNKVVKFFFFFFGYLASSPTNGRMI